MKYKFIAAIHNIKLDSEKNKGKIIFDNVRLSNGEMIIKNIMNSNLAITTIGVLSINEIKNCVYCYMEGVFKDVLLKEQMDEIGTAYTFSVLRNIQFYFDRLWDIKDNNIYLRDGFLICYFNEIEDGFTYRASLSEVFAKSSGDKSPTIITDEELKAASNNFEAIKFEEFQGREYFGKYPTADYFYKNKGSDRITRAKYFVKNARANAIMPMKVVSYCTALECLFTIGTAEINHKIAERVAILLGKNSVEKKEIYSIIKDAYKYRSLLVHGQHLKVADDYLSSISIKLDGYLRTMLNNDTNLFDKDDLQMEEFFTNRLFE